MTLSAFTLEVVFRFTAYEMQLVNFVWIVFRRCQHLGCMRSRDSIMNG
jgi:hypothetical protein